MVNPFAHTPAEKEEYVLDMLERGYSYSQIMADCHVSPSSISSIRKKFFGDDVSKSANQITKETQALKLFGQGKSLFQVATELDIATDYVFVIYQNFQRLCNREGFISKYEQVKGNLQPFLHLFDLMNNLGMTPEQVAEQVKHGYNLPYLASNQFSLSNEVRLLESQKQKLHLLMNFMRSQIDERKSSLEYYDYECQKRANELLYLDFNIKTKKDLIQNLDNDEGYTRVKEAAKKQTKLVMQDFRLTTAVTLSATFEAIRRYPDNQTLIFDITSLQDNSTGPNQQSWQSHAPQLLQMVENVQSEIAEQITRAVVNNVKSIPA